MGFVPINKGSALHAPARNLYDDMAKDLEPPIDAPSGTELRDREGGLNEAVSSNA